MQQNQETYTKSDAFLIQGKIKESQMSHKVGKQRILTLKWIRQKQL